VNYEKNPADPKEQDEEWQFKYKQESPLNKSKRNVVDPQKPLGPQYLNGALRENVQLIGIPKADYAMQCRVRQCNYSKEQ